MNNLSKNLKREKIGSVKACFQNNLGFKIEDKILRGREVSYKDGYPSVGKFILDTLGSSLDLVGQIEFATGKSHTQRVMIDRSVRCALWMTSQGLLAGDVVAICSHDQLDVPIACFATLYLGAAVSPWDEGLNAKDFRHLLNLMKPKIVFASSKSVSAVAEAARGANLDLKIIVFDRVPGFVEFETVIAEPRDEEVENFSCTHIESLDQIAMIMCSSGTTGLPKGVALSHRAFLGQVYSLKKIGMPGNNCVVFSGISWISGVIFMFMNLASNITRIVTPPFDEYSACALIEKYKPKVILLGSSMVNRLLKSDALGKYDLSSLKRVFYAGAPLAVSSHEAFSKLVPNALISAGYGLTEVGGSFSVQTANSKPGSCGQIVENAQLKVIDPKTGHKLGPDQKGELLLKTVSMMNCYYNDLKATAAAVDEEGWLHSGDLGYYDKDGEIFVLERLKELIKYRGYQISPFEIESVILSHPRVKEVAVIAVPHLIDDEHPVAFVVRETYPTGAAKQVTEKELVDLVAAELSDSKRLRGGVRFIDHLPKTPSGKALRRELRELSKRMARIDDNRQSNP